MGVDSDFMKGQQAQLRGRTDEAIRFWESSVRRHGNKAAATNLAQMHYTGWPGGCQCYDTALNYYYLALQKTPGYEFCCARVSTFDSRK